MTETARRARPAAPSPTLGVYPCAIDGVVAFAPLRFADTRGAFAELHHADRYVAAGVPATFAQDNVAWSGRGVLRGLHLQQPHGQGKLVTVLRGTVFDIAADVRVGSPTFGQTVTVELTADGTSQLWVPPGFAHGYLALTPGSIVLYKCTDVYHPECEVTLRWDDPQLCIPWPASPDSLSEKDLAGLTLAEAGRRGLLPPYEPPNAAPPG